MGANRVARGDEQAQNHGLELGEVQAGERRRGGEGGVIGRDL